MSFLCIYCSCLLCEIRNDQSQLSSYGIIFNQTCCSRPYETAALCIFNIYKNKRQECIIFILLQSIYTPVVDIHVFTQLGHFCYFIDTIGSLLKKGFDCSRLSILHWILKQILYSLSNTNHNITCLTLLRLGGGEHTGFWSRGVGHINYNRLIWSQIDTKLCI